MRMVIAAAIMSLAAAAPAEITTGSLAMKIEQRKKQIQQVDAEINKLSTARVLLEGSLRELGELADDQTSSTRPAAK